VAFPSLQTSLSSETLNAIAAGNLDDNLILTAQVVADLQSAGISVHAQTRTVAADALQNALWRDRSAYTLLPVQQLSPQMRVIWMDDIPVTSQIDRYPFALSGASVTNFDPQKLTRLTLSGVMALARNTRVALNENSVDWAASGIVDYVRESDFFHVSNEVSIVDGCPQSNADLLGGSNSFCMTPDHADLLNRLDVDIVELSGNHNNDYGYEAYRETLAFFRLNEIETVGGGETLQEARDPLRLSHNGNSIAMISCNAVGPYYALVNEDANAAGGVRPGAAACDWTWLSETLPTLSQQVDTLIVTVQHREREEYTPDDAQRFDFRRLADLGADVVMGTSAHKPQTYEFYSTSRGETALIHYGMGNLFFDQPFWGNSRFFMNTLYLYDGQVQSLAFYPGIIEEQGRPRLMTPDERRNFLFFMLVEHNRF
jgi:poly-gamma-glutamate synthesis protein (capsule biosynthesis protein)